MKEKLSLFFNNSPEGKKRKNSLILTIVALVEILAILVVSTSAWVESISSIMIHTTYDSSTNTSGTKGMVESLLTNKATLSSSSTAEIDLRNFFRQSGGYHLCGASSVDGNTMYFPEIYGGNSSNYRVGTINDKNVNYISFTIKTSAAVNFAFAQVPTIKFDDTALSASSANAKLVRFSVGDNAGNYKVFSLYQTKFVESVPAAEDGTTAQTTVYPFADYVAGKEKVVTSTANGFLSFNMWIQDPTGAKRTVYQNKALSVTNLNLVSVIPFTLQAVYTNDSGNFVAGGTGGTVRIGTTGDYSATAVKYVTTSPNTTLSLYASASASNGYQFLGFRTNGTTPIGSSTTTVQSSTNPTSHTVTTTASTQTVWALFSNTHNIYMKPEYVHKDVNGNTSNVRYAAFVFGVDSTGQTSGKWYSMTSSSYTWVDNNNVSHTENGYYKCVYRGSATNIIFCYMDGSNNTNSWANRWLQTYDLAAPSQMGEFCYNVTCRQVLNDITANGVTYDNPRNSAITETGAHDYGTNKLLGFWRHNYVKVQLGFTSNSVSGSSSSSNIYPSLIDTCKTSGHAYWYEDDYTNRRVYIDGRSYQDLDDNGDVIPQYKYDKAVMLTAEDNSQYVFAGWYSDAAGTEPLDDVTITTASGNTTYHYTDKSYPITACDNAIYDGSTHIVETADNYYAKYIANPLTWQIKWGNSTDGTWDTIDMTETGSGTNIFTCTKTLNAGEDMYFKAYNLKTSTWYGNGGSYIDMLTTTIVSNSSLSTPGSNGHIKSGFTNGATYTFTLDATGSTKKLTITASGTKPTVKIWNNNIDGGDGSYRTMTAGDTSVSTYTYTWSGITEGQDIYFKIDDQTRDEWWTNATFYNGYTTTPLLNNGTLSDSGGNMHIKAHAGTYKFTFNYSTKQLKIEVTKWSDITITFSYSGQTWVNDSSAVISFYAPDFTEANMTPNTSSTATSRTVTIKSNIGNASGSIGFNRWNNTSHSTNWNNWAAGSRGFSTTYTVTGNGAGHW